MDLSRNFGCETLIRYHQTLRQKSFKSDHALEVQVWRGAGSDGHLERFDVPGAQNQTVLDVVTWIQRHLDATLSYRFSCRVGVCGSCAMTVNGKPRWTCRTHVQKVLNDNRLVIEPLRNLPVIKDLACDMTGFFDKWGKALGQFKGRKNRQDDVERISPTSPRRRQVDAGIECINCAVCYSACDVVEWNPEYLGPAALNRAWTLHNDERDTAGNDRLRAVAGAGGCHTCHSQQGCVEHCPVEINPTASIAGLKRATTVAALKGKV